MDLSDTCVIVIPFPSIAARRNPVGFYLCGVTCSLAVMAVMFYVTESNLLSIIRFPKMANLGLGNITCAILYTFPAKNPICITSARAAATVQLADSVSQ